MLKIVFKNLWAVRAPPRTLLESSQRSPDPLASRACCPLPKNPTPLLAFGLDVRPSPNSLHFPQCVFVRVVIKTLVVPIFGAKECIRMQDFVLNIQYKKNFRGHNPGTPAVGGETFVRTHPRAHPPKRWCPSASSGLVWPCPSSRISFSWLSTIRCPLHQVAPPKQKDTVRLRPL